MTVTHQMTAILPCNDLDASEAFYARLGFSCAARHADYRILADGKGGALHLASAVEGWLVGLYLYTENVDDLAEALGVKPEDKP